MIEELGFPKNILGLWPFERYVICLIWIINFRVIDHFYLKTGILTQFHFWEMIFFCKIHHRVLGRTLNIRKWRLVGVICYPLGPNYLTLAPPFFIFLLFLTFIKNYQFFNFKFEYLYLRWVKQAGYCFVLMFKSSRFS